MITADEFVVAGDHLVYHCPTWSWYAILCGTRVKPLNIEDMSSLWRLKMQ